MDVVWLLQIVLGDPLVGAEDYGKGEPAPLTQASQNCELKKQVMGDIELKPRRKCNLALACGGFSDNSTGQYFAEKKRKHI